LYHSFPPHFLQGFPFLADIAKRPVLSAIAVTQTAGRESDNTGRFAQNEYSDGAMALLLESKNAPETVCVTGAIIAHFSLKINPFPPRIVFVR
jgi:hypothetical protein